MRKWIAFGLAVVFLTFNAPVLPAAQDPAAEALLKSKGLTRSGILYLLDGDLNLRAGLRAMRQARNQVDSALASRAEIEHQIRGARDAQLQLYAQEQSLAAQMEKVKNIPLRYNELVNQINAVRGGIAQADQYLTAREKALRAFSIPTDQYIKAVGALAAQMEQTQKQYEKLAADAEVASALARISTGVRVPFRLGPSEQFTTDLKSVRQEREKVRAAAVKFELMGGVPVVNVLLNGTLPWKMVLDSGASTVTLTYSVARELGLNPEASDPIVRLRTADGKLTEAHIKTIKSIRLAQFEVHDVECAVLPEGVGGEDLLGGTFLSHFVYQMDLNAGEVHLSQIDPPSTPIAASKNPDAATRPGETAKPEPHGGGMPSTLGPGLAAPRPKSSDATQAMVRAADGWVQTKFRVEQGRCYRLIATGLWRDSHSRECGPEGSCPKDCFALLGPQTELTKNEAADYYVGQHPRGALICRIGDQKWDFYVGAECRFMAPASGTLSFRMNDDDRSMAALPGECVVTFVRSDPEWVRPDGTVEITARIDISDALHFTRQGIFWEWDGKWGKVGLNSGFYPTVINGTYWWPDWVTKTTTNVLPVPALWPGDPSRVRIAETKAKRGTVDIKSANPDELILVFEKRPRGPGSTQIGVVLRYK